MNPIDQFTGSFAEGCCLIRFLKDLAGKDAPGLFFCAGVTACDFSDRVGLVSVEEGKFFHI